MLLVFPNLYGLKVKGAVILLWIILCTFCRNMYLIWLDLVKSISICLHRLNFPGAWEYFINKPTINILTDDD